MAAIARAQSPTPTPTPVPGEIRVQVTLSVGAKRAPGVGAVAWLPGSASPAGHAGGPARPKIASKGKRFEPRIEAVPVGTAVEFPNLDKIYHNVFSLSEGAKFDLGLYRNGASKTWKFERPGLVRVYCNIHPQMAAYLLVIDGRNYGQAGADGVVTLSGVPPGRHAVKVWEEKGGDWTGTADVYPGKTALLSVLLDATGYKDQPHKNKYGKNYPPPDEDENRY